MRYQNQRRCLLASTMIAGLAVIGVAAPAMAQSTTPTAGEESATVADIVVTGSRIRQANLTTTSPVTQVTSEDIAIQGVTRVEDLVTQLPQAFAAQNSTVSNGASGTATVSLRNLGSDRTLVLIDGRRMGYGSPNDTAADLNQVPAQLVERVEVLTGGASAVYGSDAIAGVVNFIMKKDFEGVQLDLQYGSYFHHNDYDGVGNVRAEIERRGATNPGQFRLPSDDVQDGESKEVTLAMGVSSPDGKGNLVAYAGYRNNNPVLQGERDYSACSLAAPTAARPTTFACGGSGTSFPGQFTPDFVNAYTIGAGGTFVPYSAANNAYNFGPSNYYQRPDERYTLGAYGRYQINDKAEAFAQLMFSDYSSVAQIAPTGAFFPGVSNGSRTADGSATINCDNPLLSAQQRGVIGCTPALIASGGDVPLYIGRRNVEGGGRQDSINYESYRAVVGLRGEFAEGWDYDIAAQFSRVRLNRTYLNEFSNTRLARALDVVSVGGVPTCTSVVNGTDGDCVPYDIFTGNGPSAAALQYLQVPLVQTGQTTQQVITGAVTGDLTQYGWVSPWATSGVQVAFGAEYRRDALSTTPDNSFQTGDGAGQGGATLPVAGSVDVIDAFGELQVPIIENAPFAYQVSLNAAYRRSQYSNVDTNTYNVGLDYAPVQDFRLRGSYSKAVRAPNVLELFTGQGQNLFDMDADPCGDVTGTSVIQATLAQCVATGVPAANYGSAALNSPAGQYNFLQGGNPDLLPEEAKTYTFGAVFTPSFLSGFNVSVDYFNIEVDQLISTLGALNTINLCYQSNDAAACGRINRNALGQLWVGTANVEDLNINIGGLKTSGIDVNAGYNIDLEQLRLPAYGSLQMSFVGTWLQSLETDTGAQTAQSIYDCTGFFGNQCGVPNPEWRHRARLTWVTPWAVDVSATWRYYSEVEFAVLGADGSLNNAGTRIDRYFDAQNYFDLSANWQINDRVSARIGVNNILDRDPPLSYSVGTTGNGNTYPQLYDAMGRYGFVSLTATF
ncbi:TonB-dependent receptor [Brevundimonas nasdae]|uniref:TonB-dependent receptor n=1 Tax=Brevundimonas nasdae TaxID=172043 RepID=A0A0B4C451_9CAUL|nr:TonB-dependent receptor [Brevundimonas nasdae]